MAPRWFWWVAAVALIAIAASVVVRAVHPPDRWMKVTGDDSTATVLNAATAEECQWLPAKGYFVCVNWKTGKRSGAIKPNPIVLPKE